MNSRLIEAFARVFVMRFPRRALATRLARIAAGACTASAVGVAGASDALAAKRCGARQGVKFISGSFQGPNKCDEFKAHVAFEFSVGKNQCVGEADPGCGGKCKGRKKCKRIGEIVTGGTFECVPGNPGDNPSCPDTQGFVCSGDRDWECFCACR
jgi:hypothetical protein